MSFLRGWLFGRVLRLDQSGAAPPWPVEIFNKDTGLFEPLGIGSAATGGSSSPLILPGDPPDFVTTEDGDLIMMEGRDG